MAGTKIKKRQIENLQIADIDVAAAANIAISKIAGLQAALDSKETAFSKNTAFNKNFGTIAGTVAEGNHTHAFGTLTGIPTTISGYGITDAYTKSEVDGFTVKLTGPQTVAGVKTFSAIPVLPATNPTLANQAARKGYVDGLTGTLSSLNTTDKTNLVNAINEIWTDYVPESRHIDTAIGLLGGGDISTDRLIEIDWGYMDNRYLTGLKDHEVVRIMADTNVVLSGTQTIQGIALIVGDRVLLTGQTDPAENGAYVVQSSTWVRTPDFDEVGPGEIEQGARFGVAEGTYIGTAWTLSTGGTITLGTTPLDFFQSNAGASYTPGEGIVFNGTEIAALVNEALWNANQIRGINVVSAAPTTGQLMRYNGASWAPWTPDFASASALDNYYTKTQLQTAGQSQVNWGNVTNTPTTLTGYGLTRVVSANATDITDSEVLATGGANTITNTSAVYVPLSRDNTPSWATADGGVLTVKSSSNVYRQLWIGRYGEIGLRAGTGSTQYTDDWIQLATQGWVSTNKFISADHTKITDATFFSGDFNTLPRGTYVSYITSSATNTPSGGAGALFSFGGDNVYNTKLFGGTGDGLWYGNGNQPVTYYRVASREWVNSLPALAPQTLSLGSNSGSIAISGGNSVRLTSLMHSNPGPTDWLTYDPGQGLHPFLNTTGSVNFPSASGYGFTLRRVDASTAGSFAFWKNAGDDGELYFNTGTSGSNWNGWKQLANKEWTDGNYVYSRVEKTGYLEVLAGSSGYDANTASGNNIFYGNTSGNPNFVSAGPFMSFRASSGYGAQMQLQSGGPGGGVDNFQYRGVYTDGTGDWFQVASRQWSGESFYTKTESNNKFFPADPLSAAIDVNTLLGSPGFRYINSISAGGINIPVNAFGTILTGYGSNNACQIFLPNNTGSSPYFRVLSSTGGAWNVIWHEGNLNPADYLLDTSPAGSITTQNITDWNTGLTDIAALEQDVLAINQDIAAIETELDGTVSQTNYIVREALTGAKDGVNKAFILANAPVAGKEMIFLNGQLLQEGTTADYTISGATVTLTANQAAPVSDDVILGTYIY